MSQDEIERSPNPNHVRAAQLAETMSYREVGDRLGVSQSTAHRWAQSGASAREATKAAGRSGTVNTRGFIREEDENQHLEFPESVRTYEEMRRSDATVRWSVALAQMPVRAVEQFIDPYDPTDPDALEQAAFARHALLDGEAGHLRGGWSEFLRQALDYQVHGHAVFERLAKLTEVTFKVEAPETEKAEGKGTDREVTREAFVLHKLAVRLPHTITRWLTDADKLELDADGQLKATDEKRAGGDSSELVAIQQDLGDGHEPASPVIRADRLVVFVNEQQGDNFRGLSLLRSAYKPYQFKLGLENLEAIAGERSAGLPVAYPPNDATPEQLSQVDKLLESIRQGESLWARMPGPKAGEGAAEGEGWLLEDLVIDASNFDFDVAIKRHEAALARNVIAEFMRLGHDQTGARATGDVQRTPYYEALEAVTDYLQGVINEQIIRPLIDWNYETDRYPRFRFGKVEAADLKALGELVSSLVGSKVLSPSPELEAWMRDLLDAPELPDDYERPADKPPPAPTLPPGGGGRKPPRPGTPAAAGGDEEAGEAGADPEEVASTMHAERFAVDNSAGAMVALYPHPMLAEQLAAEGEGALPAHELHITLAFLGDAEALGDPGEARRAVERWASLCPPLVGQVNGAGTFLGDAGPGGSVTWLHADLPDLPTRREHLVEQLRTAGIPPSTDHGFTPHMTLAYGREVPARIDAPVALRFDHVCLVWGEERFEYELGGSAAEAFGQPDRELEVEVAATFDANLARALGNIAALEREDEGALEGHGADDQ